MILPFSPAGEWFGFVAPPLDVAFAVGLLVVAYLLAAELLKRFATGSALRSVRGR